jgi:hypothetical protein
MERVHFLRVAAGPSANRSESDEAVRSSPEEWLSPRPLAYTCREPGHGCWRDDAVVAS